MAEWLSALIGGGKFAVSAIRESVASHEKQKRRLLYDFVLEAIGQQECLSPDSHASGK